MVTSGSETAHNANEGTCSISLPPPITPAPEHPKNVASPKKLLTNSGKSENLSE